jgi:hypothetical protein
MSPAELRLISNLPVLGIIIFLLFWVAQRLLRIEGRVIRLETKIDLMAHYWAVRGDMDETSHRPHRS